MACDMKVTNKLLDQIDNCSKKITRTSKPIRSSLPIIPEDGRSDSTTIVVCTIIFATFATIGLLVYVFQYAK